MTTVTNFDHIKLGRAFRPHVLAKLKGMSTWPGYIASKGWNGRSQSMTGADIRQACVDLGLDLNAEFVGFFSDPANVRSIVPSTGVTLTTAEATVTAERQNEDEEGELDGKESADGVTGENEGYEGRDSAELIGEVLAPASAHMTPHLAAMLPALIAPLVDAAIRGPRVITQTVVQVVGEDGSPVMSAANAAPAVNVVQRKPLHAAFGMGKSAASAAFRHAFEFTQVAICDHVDVKNPVDPDYVWDADILAQLGVSDVGGLNSWIYGPAGTGKTESASQYAARTKRPFARIAIERTTETQDLIGQEVPHKGTMVWRDGKLTRAFRIPYCVILIDEPSLLRSGSLAVLQTALDTRVLYLSTGEVVRAAEGVMIIAADNTAGVGDDTGRYVDTAALNAAFMDRFAFKVEYGYLPVAAESAMLAARTGIPVGPAKMMVNYAALTRKDTDAGKLTMGLTTRRLLNWAKAVKAGIGSAKAFTSCIVAGAAPEDRQTLVQLATSSVDHALIDGIVRGTIDPGVTSDKARVQGAVGSAGLRFPDDEETL
jgi:MoxR-like ATPase